MLAKLPGHIRVKNTDDITDKFLLLHNSHDGFSSLRVHFTPVRVVCQNTLSIAERNARGQGISIRHRGELETKIREAQRVLGLANQFYEELQPKIDRLADYYPTADQLQGFFNALYPDPVDGNATRAQNVRAELLRLFEDGIGQDIPGIRHSAWAALHAVTEYVDHKRPTRGRGDLDRSSRRLQSQWFGSGARLKQRAWDLALEMAN
jgi:phage/plasmid-like protein (TIGR03299 family)